MFISISILILGILSFGLIATIFIRSEIIGCKSDSKSRFGLRVSVPRLEIREQTMSGFDSIFWSAMHCKVFAMQSCNL